MSDNSQKVLDLVEKLTIVELAELVEAMEEKFGVSAAAPVAAAGGAAPAEEEGGTVGVFLKDCGANKIGTIKLVREYTGLGLGEAKTLSETGGAIKENIEKKEAEEIVQNSKKQVLLWNQVIIYFLSLKISPETCLPAGRWGDFLKLKNFCLVLEICPKACRVVMSYALCLLSSVFLPTLQT
jgi:large subunit ribosomal protein L7/L12